MEFDLTQAAKNAIQNVVNNTLYRGKPIIEWINFIANNADDLISRQAAIECLIDALYDLDEADYVDNTFIEEELKKVPAVQPEQKKGRWIQSKHTDTVLCSQCGKCYGDEYNYCPNCGAKMKREGKNDKI